MSQPATPEAAFVRLGTPEAEFSEYRGRVIAGYLFAGLMALMGFAFLLALFLEGENVYFYAMVCGVALCFLGSAVGFLARQRRRRGLRAWLCPGGLVFKRSGQVSAWPWPEIESVAHKTKMASNLVEYYCGVYTVGDLSVHKVRKNDGESLEIDMILRDSDHLGGALAARVSRHLWPEAIKAFDAGGDVEFGKLRVNRVAICKGTASLPWDEVGSVTVENGIVHVRKPSGGLAWLGVPTGKTPNTPLLLALVDRATAGAVS